MTGFLKFISIAVVWVGVLGGGAIAYKYLLLDPGVPSGDLTKDGVAKNKDGVDPRVKKRIKLAIDSFSGYWVFRSDVFKEKLAQQGLGLDLVDDNADYAKRMTTLQKGDTPLAVFTVDQLLLNSPPGEDPPATIIMLIDETRGADAMVSYKSAIPNVDALNRDGVKISLTPGSPSETLTRVVRSHFDLDKLSKDYLFKPPGVEEKGAAAVYQDLLNSPASARKAFVLWEPFVSKALQNPAIHVLVDSSRFRGYIVDVLVAQRSFLNARENQEDVKKIVKTYLEVMNAQQGDSDSMVKLIVADSAKVGEKLPRDEAEKVFKGIWWKNTAENYAHFGVLPNDKTRGLQRLLDMIKNIVVVLNNTRAAGERELKIARPDKFMDDDIVRYLYDANPPTAADLDTIRAEVVAPPLDAKEWKDLQPVGTFKAEPIEFARASSRLQGDADRKLDDLVYGLKNSPLYYIEVQGHAIARGDADANRKLAEERAREVGAYLSQHGIEAHRIRTVARPPGEGKVVSFVVLQSPSR